MVWNGTTGQYEWQLGWTAGLTPYIASQDSFQEDVLEAGTLVGLSSAGQFEIQTAFYTTANGGADMVADALVGHRGLWRPHHGPSHP